MDHTPFRICSKCHDNRLVLYVGDDMIIIIIYWILGYLAINKVWYSRHTYFINNVFAFYVRKIVYALFLGWIAIPLSLIMILFGV